MLSLVWPLVIGTTVILYVGILVTLPFNPTLAAVLLLTLIGFWSRLPGIGMHSPLYFLYLLDFVDIFTILIAINIGVKEAIIFSVFVNMWSRLCGIFPMWPAVIKDSIATGIAAVLTPFLYAFSGGDLGTTVVLFTIVRALMFIPMRIVPFGPWSQFWIEFFGAGTALVIINWIYAQLFGWYLEGLLQKEFDWILFLLVTIAILGFKIYALGHSTSIPLRKALHTALRSRRKKPTTLQPVLSMKKHISSAHTIHRAKREKSNQAAKVHDEREKVWEREHLSKR